MVLGVMETGSVCTSVPIFSAPCPAPEQYSQSLSESDQHPSAFHDTTPATLPVSYITVCLVLDSHFPCVLSHLAPPRQKPQPACGLPVGASCRSHSQRPSSCLSFHLAAGKLTRQHPRATPTPDRTELEPSEPSSALTCKSLLLQSQGHHGGSAGPWPSPCTAPVAAAPDLRLCLGSLQENCWQNNPFKEFC